MLPAGSGCGCQDAAPWSGNEPVSVTMPESALPPDTATVSFRGSSYRARDIPILGLAARGDRRLPGIHGCPCVPAANQFTTRHAIAGMKPKERTGANRSAPAVRQYACAVELHASSARPPGTPPRTSPPSWPGEDDPGARGDRAPASGSGSGHPPLPASASHEPEAITTRRELTARWPDAYQQEVEHWPCTCPFPEDAVLQARQAHLAFTAHSLDAPLSHDDDPAVLADVLGQDDPDLSHATDIEAVRAHLDELPEREQRILTWRLYGNLTHTQIGDRLGISQMHVSRLTEKALTYLCGQLTRPA